MTINFYMGEIEKGDRMKLRWSNNRYRSVSNLGWEQLDSGTAVDRAFNMAEDLDDLIYKYDAFLRGELNLGKLMKALNQVRKYK